MTITARDPAIVPIFAIDSMSYDTSNLVGPRARPVWTPAGMTALSAFPSLMPPAWR